MATILLVGLRQLKHHDTTHLSNFLQNWLYGPREPLAPTRCSVNHHHLFNARNTSISCNIFSVAFCNNRPHALNPLPSSSQHEINRYASQRFHLLVNQCFPPAQTPSRVSIYLICIKRCQPNRHKSKLPSLYQAYAVLSGTISKIGSSSVAPHLCWHIQLSPHSLLTRHYF
jgi:hypothetical protein